MVDSRRDRLSIVNVQNDLCPGGALEVPGRDAVVPVINGLRGAFEHRVLTWDRHGRHALARTADSCRR